MTIEKKITKNNKLRFYVFNGYRKVQISRKEAEELVITGKAEYGKLFY